jgi:hypothetical protein
MPALSLESKLSTGADLGSEQMTEDVDNLGRNTLSSPDAQAQAGAQGGGQMGKAALGSGFQRLSPASWRRETWRKDDKQIQAWAHKAGEIGCRFDTR